MAATARTPLRWDLDPAPVDPAGAGLRPRHGTGGRVLPVTHAVTGEPLTEVATDGLDMAVAAARTVQPAWAGLDGLERGKRLFGFSRALELRAGALDVAVTLDTGRPIRDADGAVAAAAVFSAAGWADKVGVALAGRAWRAAGVAVLEVPAGSGLRVVAGAAAHALAAGCAVVLRPDPATPLAAVLLAELAAEAGLPEGLLGAAPDAAVPDAAAAPHPAAPADLVLALPGPAAPLAIVFEDAALDDAVAAVATGGRVLVQESAAAELGRRLWDRLRRVRAGDPLDRNTEVWQAADPAALAALAAAAGGIRRDAGAGRPTLLTGVPVLPAPVPGPLVAVATFRTPDEAVAEARPVPGPAGVWTAAAGQALAVAQALGRPAVGHGHVPAAPGPCLRSFVVPG